MLSAQANGGHWQDTDDAHSIVCGVAPRGRGRGARRAAAAGRLRGARSATSSKKGPSRRQADAKPTSPKKRLSLSQQQPQLRHSQSSVH
jgi:hypothetical protein